MALCNRYSTPHVTLRYPEAGRVVDRVVDRESTGLSGIQSVPGRERCYQCRWRACGDVQCFL